MTYRTVRQKLADQRSEEIREEGIAKLKAIRESIPCEACTEATTNPCTGMFNGNCRECDARAIAGGPLFFEVAKLKAMTPEYVRQMKAVFGEDWKPAHERVKVWAARMAEARHQFIREYEAEENQTGEAA
jgi:hypothetical protein